MTMFYYFLKRSIDDEPLSAPIITDTFMGDVNDYIEFDGVGYIITDFAVENHDYAEMESDY